MLTMIRETIQKSATKICKNEMRNVIGLVIKLKVKRITKQR